jgi:hypothetical protein
LKTIDNGSVEGCLEEHNQQASERPGIRDGVENQETFSTKTAKEMIRR